MGMHETLIPAVAVHDERNRLSRIHINSGIHLTQALETLGKADAKPNKGLRGMLLKKKISCRGRSTPKLNFRTFS